MEPAKSDLIENRQIRVFISSTFRDMQAERDHLVTRVFPSLRRYCEERDVSFFELDLRWGISEEESKQGKVVDICLKEIQKATPFFIGILGERYGWVPSEEDKQGIASNTNVFEEYPWINAELDKGTSITEIEIQQGVLRAQEKVNAYFYFRSPKMETPPDFAEQPGSREAQKLQNLKTRIHEQNEYPIKNYVSIEELGKFVERDFKELVNSLFPEGTMSYLEKERLEQCSFLKSKTRLYIPIPGDENRIDEFINGNEKALVVTSDRGMGKSAYLADWIAKRQKDPVEGINILYHFIGASRSQGDYHKILQRLINEVEDIYRFKNETDTGEIIRDALNENTTKGDDTQKKILQDLLHAVPQDKRLIIILDGVDKLTGGDNAKLLNWLPEIPENIKFIFSTCGNAVTQKMINRVGLTMEMMAIPEDNTMDYFRRMEYPLMPIKALNVQCRKRFITNYLLSFGKKLSSVHVERIIKDDKSKNPLILRALLDEIRLFGIFEELDITINRYLAEASIPQFFALLLDRIEKSFYSADKLDGKSIVTDILSLIYVSRSGLAEQEILDLSGASPVYWSQLYNALSGHISMRSGLVTFDHSFMQDAVKYRYWLNAGMLQAATTEAENVYRKRIANYMKSEKTSDKQRSREYPFQLTELKDWDALYVFLLNIDVFQYLYTTDKYELERYWRSLEKADNKKYSLEKFLEIDIADKEKNTQIIINTRLGNFSYDIIVNLELSLQFYQKAFTVQEKVFGEKNPHTAIGYSKIGNLHNRMGNYQKAFDFYQKALNIQEKVHGEQHSDTAIIYSNIGNLHNRMGNYQKAFDFYQKALNIQEKVLGEQHPDTALSYSGIGVVLDKLGEYSKAMEFHQKALTIQEKVLGKNAPDTIRSVWNIFGILVKMGAYSKALDFVVNPLGSNIPTEILGEKHPDTASFYNRLGVYHSKMSDYPQALEFHQKALIIQEELLGQKHPDTSVSYNSIGAVYNDMKDYQKALEFLQKALDVCEEVLGNNHPDTAVIYGNIGAVYGNTGDYSKALEFLQKALFVQEEILGTNHPDTAVNYNYIGLVYRKLGDYSKALEFCQKALAIREDVFPCFQKHDKKIKDYVWVDKHPDTATSYNTIGFVYGAMGDYQSALKFHKKALAIRNKALEKHHPDWVAIHSTIGLVYDAMGDYQNALKFHKKALAIFEKFLTYRLGYTTITKYYNNIGSVYDKMGDYPNALEFYEKTLYVHENFINIKRTDIATSYYSVGGIYNKMHNFSKALKFCQKALAIREEILPKNHPDTAVCYNSIGFLYSKMGNYPQALEYYRKVLSIREETLEAKHTVIAESYNTIGLIYYRMGDYPHALDHYRKALEIREEVLRASHPETAISYNNIGNTYSNMSDYPKALEYHQKALAVREKVFGIEYPDTAVSYSNIGLAYTNMGNYEKALEFRQKALAVREKVFGIKHPLTAAAHEKAGAAYKDMGDYPQALDHYRQALEIYLALGNEKSANGIRETITRLAGTQKGETQ